MNDQALRQMTIGNRRKRHQKSECPLQAESGAMVMIKKMTLLIAIQLLDSTIQHPENASAWPVQHEMGSPAQGNSLRNVTCKELHSEKEAKAFPKGVREWLLIQRS